jgi:hypothetical protein
MQNVQGQMKNIVELYYNIMKVTEHLWCINECFVTEECNVMVNNEELNDTTGYLML